MLQNPTDGLEDAHAVGSWFVNVAEGYSVDLVGNVHCIYVDSPVFLVLDLDLHASIM